jgi:hypothetical protein
MMNEREAAFYSSFILAAFSYPDNLCPSLFIAFLFKLNL